MSDREISEIEVLREAADRGEAEAQYEYAVRLANGDGVPVDEGRATRYYKLSADQGHAKAQFAYAFRLAYNNKVPAIQEQAAY
jgi:TPR repeat protein